MKHGIHKSFLGAFCVMIVMVYLASCGGMPISGTNGLEIEIVQEGEDYDFSVFFGHAEDPITVGRIVLRYKAETGISIRPITTDADAADDRFLRRYLGSSNPPAAFALPADASETVSAAGIGWRFHGRGFAADRRVLADLIGVSDAAAPEVDAFVEDIRLADYGEWTIFLGELGSYIRGATHSAITLNDKSYSFADSKGRFSSRLNGIIALGGADPEFVGVTLMDLAAITSEQDSLEQSRLLSTPQAFTAVSPIIDTYIAALDEYTSNIAGLYAPGIRGDDFINGEIYDSEYTGTVFAEQKAVFIPFDSEAYATSDVADATQAEQIVLLPVKMPYAEHWLGGYLDAVDVNKSLRLNTEYSLCVNDQAPATVDEARNFIEWLAADEISSDAIQLSMAKYHDQGAELPLIEDGNNVDANGMAVFGGAIYASDVKPMLSDSEWRPEEVAVFRNSLCEKWLSAG